MVADYDLHHSLEGKEGVFHASLESEEMRLYKDAWYQVSYADAPETIFELLRGIKWDGSPCVSIGVDRECWLLHFFVVEDNIEIARALVQQGLDVSLLKQNPAPEHFPSPDPLNAACRLRSYEAAKFCLEHGLDPNMVSKEGCTPLLSIISSTSTSNRPVEAIPAFVKLLLDAGADPNMKGDSGGREGSTPLTCALHFALPTDVIQMLIHAGANVNLPGETGRTPIFFSSQPELTTLLLDHGANTEHTDDAGRTVLHEACRRAGRAVAAIDRWVEIIRILLLQGGMDVNAMDKEGLSPFFCHVREHLQPRVYALLKEHGLDRRHRDLAGRSVFHYSKSRHVAIFVKDGFDINTTTLLGRNLFHDRVITPFFDYDFQGSDLDREAYEEMLKFGVDINAQDCHGWTPLHYATFFGHANLVSLLLDLGAINQDDNKGRTPVHYCAIVFPYMFDDKADFNLIDFVFENGGEWSEVWYDCFVKKKSRTCPTPHCRYTTDAYKTFEILLAAGAGPTKVDSDGNFPFTLACGLTKRREDDDEIETELTIIYRMLQEMIPAGWYC